MLLIFFFNTLKEYQLRTNINKLKKTAYRQTL